mmetsp:Transcript_82762/g.239147  ORF Transcript_82762/g.239147 Transcript_82762/m.239147 type:complete len:273 (-) Transcript_82762:2191-3009(-)
MDPPEALVVVASRRGLDRELEVLVATQVVVDPHFLAHHRFDPDLQVGEHAGDRHVPELHVWSGLRGLQHAQVCDVDLVQTRCPKHRDVHAAVGDHVRQRSFALAVRVHAPALVGVATMGPELDAIALALGQCLPDVLISHGHHPRAQNPVQITEVRDLRRHDGAACVQHEDPEAEDRCRRQAPSEKTAGERVQAPSRRERRQRDHLGDVGKAGDANAHDRDGRQADWRARQSRAELVHFLVPGDDVQPHEHDRLRPHMAQGEVLRQALQAAD